MNVDPRWLRDKVSGGVIDADRTCACGYSLRGLRTGGTCPECGRAIPLGSRASAVTVRPITDYPARVLARHAGGATCMALGAWVMTMGYLALWLQRGFNVTVIDVPPALPLVIHALGVFPATILWWLGVVLLTTRDPEYTGGAPTPAYLLAGRPGWTRAAIVLPQALWIVSEGLTISGIFIEEASLRSGVGLQLGGYAAAALACIALTPVCFMLRELAYHGSDDYAANRFQGLAFGIPLAGAVLTLLPIVPFMLGVSRMATFISLLVFSVLLTPVVYLMLRALWSVGTTYRWAWRNAESAAEREERFLDRARRTARGGR
ncbi:MAG: hypothetical protein AB7K52_09140 [Phycisphaerales bacterium]